MSFSLQTIDVRGAQDVNASMRRWQRQLQASIAAGGTSAAGPAAPEGERPAQPETPSVERIVRDILARVRSEGDTALIELTTRFDGPLSSGGASVSRHGAPSLRVAEAELEAAYNARDRALFGVLESAERNIRAYQQHIKVRAPAPLELGGRRCGVRYTPIDRVGLYVPGGRAFYPSSLLMTAIPAQEAGVRELVLTSPASGGRLHKTLMALAWHLGIREVYRVGGAQAVGALAFGTDAIAPVDMVVGPGNAFVAEAKRQVLGVVGIDAIAGPSEVLIIADGSADPEHVALDLMSQAEHDPGSAVLVSPDATLLDNVNAALGRWLEPGSGETSHRSELTRRDAVAQCLKRFGVAIHVQDLQQACACANALAPEHLQLMTADNPACLDQIRHAGALFVGAHTPVALGDYWAGPSHVLPTAGTARFFSPLSVNTFLKATSLIEYSAEALAQDGASIATFAEHEGLTAHALSVDLRIRGKTRGR